MKARLPQSAQPQNYNQMLKQAQKMQEEMAKAQDALADKEYSCSGGGGNVDIVINGRKEIVSIKIAPQVVDPEDIEFLQDMIASTVNSAIKMVEEDAADVLGKITGPLGI